MSGSALAHSSPKGNARENRIEQTAAKTTNGAWKYASPFKIPKSSRWPANDDSRRSQLNSAPSWNTARYIAILYMLDTWLTVIRYVGMMTTKGTRNKAGFYCETAKDRIAAIET